MRMLILSCLLVLSSLGHGPAAASGDPQPVEDANAHAERITDAKKYLADIDQALALAYSGEYGRLKRGSEKQLQTARDRIADLLAGHTSARELPPEDRIAIYDAQQEINSILNNQDKNRVICRREARTGSRLATINECMTIAEREARANLMREGVDKIQRNFCIPGEGQPCGN